MHAILFPIMVLKCYDDNIEFLENLNDSNHYKILCFYPSYDDKCKGNMVKIVQKQSLKKCTSKGVIIFLSHRIYSNFMQKDLCKNIIFNLVLDGST